MFKFLFAAALLLSGGLVKAQDYSITGKVSGPSNQTLGGATVQIVETKRVTITDEFGRFSFLKVLPGEYTLTVKYVGFETKTERVSIRENTALDFQLVESVHITDEVVVYATRASDKTPTTYTNVSQQALQKQNFGQDLPFLLNWTPSLVTTSDAGAGIGYTGIRIRGSDATRINVTINGIPYNDSESQGTFWVDIPDIASSVQSVQIQRGVGTSTNGASAFGASVNLQTASLRTEPYAEATLGTGSFNTFRTLIKAGTGLINDHWAFDARASKISSDGYIDRSTSDLRSYFMSGGYYGKGTIVKALAFGGHEVTYQAWYGLDGPTMKSNRKFNYAGALYDADYNVIGYHDNEEDNYRQDNYQLHFSQQLNSYWTTNISLHYTYGRGYYEQYRQDRAFSRYGLQNIILKDTVLTHTDLVTRKWLDNHFYGTTFSFNYEKDKMNFILGGGYNKYANARHYGEIIWAQHASNARPGHQWYDGEANKTDLNIYAKAAYDVTPRLNAFADIQYRNVGYKTAGIDDDLTPYQVNDEFSFVNPKAGISYSISDNNVLYASFAIAHREPNRTDYLDGDEKPKAERLNNLEAGWRKSTHRYNLEANYYLMEYKDQLVLTGALNNVGNPIRANIGESFRTGVELSAGLRLSKQFTWNVNATASRNQNRNYAFLDEDSELQNRNTAIILSPDFIAGSQLSWNSPSNFQMTLLSKYVGKQFLDNTENESLALDAYFVNDLRLSYLLPLKGTERVEASFLVNNIFAVEYASNGYSYDGVPYFYPQATRNFMAMLTIGF